MKTPVIVDAVRTPIGRAHADRGYYRFIRSVCSDEEQKRLTVTAGT